MLPLPPPSTLFPYTTLFRSYPHVGASRDDAPPPGFVADHRRVLLGAGDETFAAACACLRRWDMFDLGWVNMSPRRDRKSTRLNSSHANTSYAVLCLKKTKVY